MGHVSLIWILIQMTNYLKIRNSEGHFTIDWAFKGNRELLYFSSRGGSDDIGDISVDLLCPYVCLRFCYILIVVQFNLLFKFIFKALRHCNFLEIFTVVFLSLMFCLAPPR